MFTHSVTFTARTGVLEDVSWSPSLFTVAGCLNTVLRTAEAVGFLMCRKVL
jgi:hypothetical protein